MDYLFCPTSCFCEKSKCAPVEGNIVPELIGTNNSDKQIWELDDICKLINMIYWFYRNKIAALFGIDRVGKILTDCLSDTL